MRQEDREMVGSLFTWATEILEDTHIPASETQRPKSVAQCRKTARVILKAGEDLQEIAKTVLVLVRKR